MTLENGHGRNLLGIVISFLLVFSALYTVQFLYIYILYIYIYIYIHTHTYTYTYIHTYHDLIKNLSEKFVAVRGQFIPHVENEHNQLSDHW